MSEEERPTKVAASNVSRLEKYGMPIEDDMRQAIENGEVEVGWMEPPAPPAIVLPAPVPGAVDPQAINVEMVLKFKPLPPVCIRHGREVGEWLSGVEGWPCREGDIIEPSDEELDTAETAASARKYTSKDELHDVLTTIMVEQLHEDLVERAQSIFNEFPDFTEEEAAEKLEQLRGLIRALLEERDMYDQVVAGNAALRPYSAPDKSAARRAILDGAEASRASDDAWAAEAAANSKKQVDLREYTEDTAATSSHEQPLPTEPTEYDDLVLGSYKSNTQTFTILAMREPISVDSGDAPDLAGDLLQDVPRGTAGNPMAGTKKVAWIVITLVPERGAEMPSCNALYDQLVNGMGGSIQCFGLKHPEARAVVLVKKVTQRILRLPTFQNLVIQVQTLNFPKSKGTHENEKFKCLCVAGWISLRGECKTCITLKVTDIEAKRSGGVAYSSAEEAYEYVKDMKTKPFCFLCADLKIKVKNGEDLSSVEQTILVVRSDLEHLRESRARAKSFVRVLGEDGTELVFPDSFITPVLGDVKGTYRDMASGRDFTCGLHTFANTSMHLQRTAVLYGPPDCGKTPLAEALAARWAEMYQPGSGEYYIVTSTPDSLRLMADEDLLAPGVPIIFEELEAKDRKAHARPLTANVMKHLCGVRDGGVVSARYRDFALHRKQPRIICCNSDPQDWLDAITDNERDQLALRKRVVFFELTRPVISTESDDTLGLDLQHFLNEGHTRLAAKRRQ